MSRKSHFLMGTVVCLGVFWWMYSVHAAHDTRSAETAFVSTGDALIAQAGATIEVPIHISTIKPLSGMQISLKYEAAFMTPGTPVTTERTSGMSVAHNAQDGRIVILLYDVSGKTIEVGNEPVLTIPFTLSQEAQGKSELVFQEVILADEDARAVPAEVKSMPVSVERAVPTTYGLSQNYPNPFNPETVIHFQLPDVSHVTLTIYNVLGQEVRRLVEEEKPAGFHRVVWDGKNRLGEDVSSGVYFYSLKAGHFESIKRMMMLK